MTDMPKRIYSHEVWPTNYGTVIICRESAWDNASAALYIRADAIDTEARAQIRREVVEQILTDLMPEVNPFAGRLDLQGWLAEQEANDSKLTGRSREAGER